MNAYPTDLTDRQYEFIKFIIDSNRKRKWTIREILNAIFYVLKSGIQWRMLPKYMPPWQTVYWYFRKWTDNGTMDLLYERSMVKCRAQVGKAASPSVGIIDSQTVKSAPTSGQRGYGAGKKTNGTKRHIVTDTLGLIIGVVVHGANIQDRDGAKFVLNKIAGNMFGFPRLKVFFADGGYSGKLLEWVMATFKRFNWEMKAIKRNGPKVFQILPKRCIVERTFGWLYQQRRMVMSYERKNVVSGAMVKFAMIRLMVQRIK